MWRSTLALVCWAMAAIATAHPLGNATVNRQAGITVSAQKIELRYVLDLAEIPTLVMSQEADTDQDGDTSATELAAYTQRWARDTLGKLDLRLDGQPLLLRLENRRWSRLPGAAGLPAVRFEARYSAPLKKDIGEKYVTRGVVEYRDRTTLAESGWREVFIQTGKGVKRLSADVPAQDRSRGLTQFPASLIAAYPQETSARAELEWSPVAVVPVPVAAPVQVAPAEIAEPIAPIPLAVKSLVAPQPRGWSQARAFFALGVYHIATGWDHLAFLFGLLLFGLSTGRLIKIITAFTIAHSTTLALASLGWIVPPSTWIEPAIALSVAYVGLANLLWRKNGHGIFLAFAFGLIHGFGFAGVLAEILAQDQGNGRWLLSLASFNLGIEVFQVLVIVLTVPLLRWIARFPWSIYARQVASLSIFGAGIGWFTVRTLAF